MKEVISSILEAEARAESIIKDAADKAKKIIVSGEEKAEEIRSAAIEDFKAKRKADIAVAENIAAEKYAAAVEKGEKQAEELLVSVSGKIEDTADYVLKEIVG